MKRTLLEMTQVPEVAKSTVWARENKERVYAQQAKRRHSLDGKLMYTVANSRNRAKNKGWEHTITREDLHELYKKQDGVCALTGWRMAITGPKGSQEEFFSVSVDRIDGAGGYTPDNIQLVCSGVNRLRGPMSVEQFFAFVSQVYDYNKLGG